MHDARPRRQVRGEAGDHGEDEHNNRGEKEAEWFLEKIRPAAVPEDDANRDSKRDQGEAGDKNNVQPTHTVAGKKRYDRELDRGRDDSGTQTIRPKVPSPKRHFRGQINHYGRRARPGADFSEAENLQQERSGYR